MSTRRRFIRNSALTALGTAFLPGFIRACPGKHAAVGLQLYTVRDQMSNDLKGTLKKISRIGYTWLEAAGYEDGLFYGKQPLEFQKMVEACGLQLVSSHAAFTDDRIQQAIDAHAQAGVKYIVYPHFPVEQDGMIPDFRRAADRLNMIGEKCSEAGIRFGYHNHDSEFMKVDEVIGYDILLSSTDPQLVCFEADIYWMIFAGVEPGDFFKKYPGRFDLWHIKDMDGSPERNFTEVGTGIIPYGQFFESAQQAGLKFFFVEQDRGMDNPMESIGISYRNLQKILP